MTRKTSVAALFVLVACLIPRISLAGTVTLTVEPSSGSPYDFSINGSSTLSDLSCLNDQRQVNVGESWTASAENLESMIADPIHNPTDGPGTGTMTVTELKEDAYLDSLYTSNATSATNLEIQDAIWTILDRATGKIGSSSYVYTNLTGPSLAAEETAVQNDYAAAISAHESSTFYSEFTFYAPVYYGQPNQYDKSGTIPQQFLGYKPITPEPSSLILLGTGILGLAGTMRRRSMALNRA